MPADGLTGVLPVLQLPFDETFDVDNAELAGEIDWVLEQGASGLVLGMVSEVLRLSTSERSEVAETVCAHCAGRVPVVVSVTAESTRLATDLAVTAAAAGATALMATLPVSGRVLPAEAVKHFAAILECTSLPVVVQDAAGYIGFELPVEAMAEIERRYGERVMFKPESAPLGPRISELLAATGGRAAVYEGSGGIALVDAFRRGVAGTMPAADLCWAIVALWDALQRDDVGLVRAIRGPLTAMISLQSSLDAYVMIEKHLLVVQGVLSSSRMRGPLGYVLEPGTARDAEGLLGELAEVVGRRLR